METTTKHKKAQKQRGWLGATKLPRHHLRLPKGKNLLAEHVQNSEIILAQQLACFAGAAKVWDKVLPGMWPLLLHDVDQRLIQLGQEMLLRRGKMLVRGNLDDELHDVVLDSSFLRVRQNHPPGANHILQHVQCEELGVRTLRRGQYRVYGEPGVRVHLHLRQHLVREFPLRLVPGVHQGHHVVQHLYPRAVPGLLKSKQQRRVKGQPRGTARHGISETPTPKLHKRSAQKRELRTHGRLKTMKGIRSSQCRSIFARLPGHWQLIALHAKGGSKVYPANASGFSSCFPHRLCLEDTRLALDFPAVSNRRTTRPPRNLRLTGHGAGWLWLAGASLK